MGDNDFFDITSEMRYAQPSSCADDDFDIDVSSDSDVASQTRSCDSEGLTEGVIGYMRERLTRTAQKRRHRMKNRSNSVSSIESQTEFITKEEYAKRRYIQRMDSLVGRTVKGELISQ